MLTWLIVIPLLLIVVVNLPFRKETQNAAAFWLALLLSLAQAAMLFAPTYPTWSGDPSWLSRFLRVSPLPDLLSNIMFLAIGIVTATTLCILRYWTPDGSQRFLSVNLVLLALAGMNGIVLSNDLFSLYVYLELTAIASFVLIASEKSKLGFEGAFKYLVQSAFATVLILSGIALIFLCTGYTSFFFVAIKLREPVVSEAFIMLSFSLLMTGFLIKGGLMPFHGWLPDSYSGAPAPVSVLLAGMITKTTGIYTLIRLVKDVFGVSPRIQLVLFTVGCLSLVAGALLALIQTDLKRMLAYSSISQVGYIVLGLAAGNPLGITGAIFHLFNHSIFKSLLFVDAAAVEKETGTRSMEQMSGLSNKMPLTGATSIIGFLSTAGIPPFSGFWSKLMIILGVWRAGHMTIAFIAIAGSLLTLGYFLVMQRRVFFGKTAPEYEDLQEANAWATAPAVMLALMTLILGVIFPWLFESFLLPIGSFL